MDWKSRGSVAVVVGCCLLSGCSGSPPESATIARAERLTVYEGLPHQMYEPKSLASERKSKPTIELHGFPFYCASIELKPGDAEKLKALLGNPRSFEPFSGEKKCGGFHPDYAVEWTVGDKISDCLICFGCGEVMIHGPGTESRYDLQGDALKLLKAILQPYRINRPPQQSLEAASPFPSRIVDNLSARRRISVSILR